MNTATSKMSPSFPSISTWLINPTFLSVLPLQSEGDAKNLLSFSTKSSMMIPTGQITVPTNTIFLLLKRIIFWWTRLKKLQQMKRGNNTQQPTTGKQLLPNHWFKGQAQVILSFIKTIKWIKFMNKEISPLLQCPKSFTKGKSPPSTLCWCKTFKKSDRTECTDQLILAQKELIVFIFHIFITYGFFRWWS